MNRFLRFLIAAISFFMLYQLSYSQSDYVQKGLGDFDQYMEKILKDWNCPGVGIGIIHKNKMTFVKGYGYRDLEKKQPITGNTLFQIASNTKLFTSVLAGFLVEDGKLDWDKPIRKYIPEIEFYNDELNNTISLRDMLAHRTGVSRHDAIWYKSDISRKDLLGKLKYLKPSQPIRSSFLYNNIMYSAVGQIIEMVSQKTWEVYMKEKILVPLSMPNTMFSITDMKKKQDYFVPFNEKRDSDELYKIPFYEETNALGPAGSMISNINDLSHWLIALMNDGVYEGKKALPSQILQATLTPSIAIKNSMLENKGYTELLNPVYGMGRQSASYRGRYISYHGGDINGIHSQISYMPNDELGVIIFVIGDHCAPLSNVLTYNIYERILGMEQTPWSDRRLKDVKDAKQASKSARQKSGDAQVTNTTPSHPLTQYAGLFDNPAYGSLKISNVAEGLQFDFRKISMPLKHYHYDRFDTPDDEQDGIFSLNFLTNPQGDIDKITIGLDENEVIFTRKPDPTLSDPKKLSIYTGKYEMGGYFAEVEVKNGNELFLKSSGQPEMKLIPYKPNIFKTEAFSDITIEFTVDGGKAKILKMSVPGGVYEFNRK